jgi:hypothetical protein
LATCGRKKNEILFERTLEVYVAVVEENNTNVTPIVFIDDTSTNIDEILDCKARARGHTSIGAGGNGNGKISLRDTLAAGRDHNIVSTVNK